MKRNLSTLLYVGLVFFSGGAVGAVATRLYFLNSVSARPNSSAPTTPTPEQWRKAYSERIHSRLSLNDEQMKKLEVILDETRAKGKALKARVDKEASEKSRPEMRLIQDEQVQKINEMLSDPQKVEYEKFRAELRVEREKRRQQQKNNAGKAAIPPGD